MKKETPDFVLDIRNGKYRWDEAVSILLSHAGIKKHPVDVVAIAKSLGFSVYENVSMENSFIAAKIYDQKEPIFVNDQEEKRAILISKNVSSVEEKMQIVAHAIAHFVLHVSEKYDFYEEIPINR